MKAKLHGGGWTFKEPLGYVRHGAGPDSTLVPEPTIAPLIRDAFEQVASGCHALADVLRMLTSKGLRGRSGKALTLTRFQSILRNPLYAGIARVESLGIETEGTFVPIVARELFDRTQAILRRRGRTAVSHARDNPDFPLRRFVRCAHCDTPMTGSFSRGRSNTYPYYSCRNASCRGVSVTKAVLESSFVGFVAALAPRQEYIELFRVIVIDTWRQFAVDSERGVRAAEKRIAELKERKRLLVEAFVYRRAIEHEATEESARIDASLAVAEIELNEARSDDLDIEAVLSFANHVLTDAARLWLEFDGERRRRFQAVLFPEGVVFDGREFRTGSTVCIFNDIREITRRPVASPTGFEPVLSP